MNLSIFNVDFVGFQYSYCSFSLKSPLRDNIMVPVIDILVCLVFVIILPKKIFESTLK